MLGYELDLALRSFRRNRVLTLADGAGDRARHRRSDDDADGLHGARRPIRLPGPEPEPLHRPPRSAGSWSTTSPGEEPPDQLTRFDAEALLREKRADRQALMTGGFVAIQPEQASLQPFRTEARFTSADFFAMFGTPFVAGGGWSAADDEARARVAVISHELAPESSSATSRAVGTSRPHRRRRLPRRRRDGAVAAGAALLRPLLRQVRRSRARLRSVLDLARPEARAHRHPQLLGIAALQGPDLSRSHAASGCSTGSSSTAQPRWPRTSSYLDDYSARQKAVGRYERPPNTRLYDVMQYLRVQEVVPEDVRLQVWLAFGFLGVCLLNTVGLLLAKCLRRSPEIGVRRALGASQATHLPAVPRRGRRHRPGRRRARPLG